MSVTAKFEGRIQSWGNSLGIRITRPMSDMAHLGKGDRVAIEVTEDGLQIRRKVAPKPLEFPFSEETLLAEMTPYTAHADELPGLLPNESGN